MDTEHTTTTDQNKLEEYDLGISVKNLILTVAIAFPILTAIVMFTIAGMRYSFNYEMQVKHVNAPHATVTPMLDKTELDLRNEQLTNIGAGSSADAAYSWKDQNQGTVTIPIDRAMELTVRDLSE